MKEMARGIRLALESNEGGEAFNLAEESCEPIGLWMRRIAAAADAEVELVKVPDDRLPEDLEIAGAIPQHWLVGASKAHERLGWLHAPAERCIAQSVRWHLDHPPAADDFSADDVALSEADSR